MKAKKVKVILEEGIRKLGSSGDVISVRRGYARNFLVPMAQAVYATKENLALVAKRREELRQKDEEQLAAANTLSAKLAELELSISCNAGDDGRLFGSVSTSDLASLMEQRGFPIARRQLSLPEPIKNVGEHLVYVDLHPKVRVELKFLVSQAHSSSHAGG